jgi:hypothetical protein
MEMKMLANNNHSQLKNQKGIIERVYEAGARWPEQSPDKARTGTGAAGIFVVKIYGRG